MGTLNITELPAVIQTKKISELVSAETLEGSEVAPVVQEGETRKTAELGGGGGVKIARGMVLDNGTLVSGSVGVDSVTRPNTGEYAIVFEAGYFTNIPKVFVQIRTGDFSAVRAAVQEDSETVSGVTVRLTNLVVDFNGEEANWVAANGDFNFMAIETNEEPA